MQTSIPSIILPNTASEGSGTALIVLYTGSVDEHTAVVWGSVVYAGTSSYANGLYADNYIDLSSTTGNPVWKEGRIFYDNTDKSLAVYSDVEDVTLQVGQEQHLRARNASGGVISNGTPVKLSGSLGNRPKIVKAIAESHINDVIHHNDFIGLATHDIDDNSDGLVTTFGLVNGIKTDYAGWSAGSRLYVGTTAGTLVTYPDTNGKSKAIVGYVVRVHQNQGSIFVNPRDNIQLHDIEQVSSSLYLTGDLLTYNGSVWTNSKVLPVRITWSLIVTAS
jgi:hypothetical protein